MICIVNAQGFATLTNDAGVAFQMPLPLVRELYRRALTDKEQLRAFLQEWDAAPEGIEPLLDDEFDAAVFAEGMSNIGLPLETMRDLRHEQGFYFETRGKRPSRLVLHPSELGMIGTALGKEGHIPDSPERSVRDVAAQLYIQQALELVSVEVDESLRIGEFRL